MTTTAKFSTYRRAEYLKTVPAADRALAGRLCALLEAAFDPREIAIYSGFPIVVRDMEWIAGFAMRKSGPVAYCCSPATLAAMGAELKPYMSGKSCVAVKPRRGETIESVLALVGRAFAMASRGGGVISQTDAKKRERMRAAEATAAAQGAASGAASKRGAEKTTKTATTKKTAKTAKTAQATRAAKITKKVKPATSTKKAT
jgi:hypothetical protein